MARMMFNVGSWIFRVLTTTLVFWFLIGLTACAGTPEAGRSEAPVIEQEEMLTGVSPTEEQVEHASPASRDAVTEGGSTEGMAAPVEELAADAASPPEGETAFTEEASERPASSGQGSQHEPVTAGVVDDNEQWQSYLDYRARNSFLSVNERDVEERYILWVRDELERPIHDASVQFLAEGQLLFEGRTDAGGRLLFHPGALDHPSQATRFSVVASKDGVVEEGTLERHEQEEWSIVLPGVPIPEEIQLDLLFLIDATGSMGDEIDKLKVTMAEIANRLAALPEQPDVRYGLAAYRDRGEAFVVRLHDFGDLASFQQSLNALEAEGGGDTPEALNEALHQSLIEMSWREENSVRLTLLLADAPPHLDYNEPFSYDSDMIEAVRRGIKIFPIGASGLDAQGEYIFRQLAQFTGGKFVFLTYARAGEPGSGPGSETSHEVQNYSVDTLDRLVLRLVSEELARLPQLAR